MNGISLAKEYYTKNVKPMLDAEFQDEANRIAVGIFGKGSECFGFDDDVSKDHDYKVGVSLFITGEDDVKFGYKLTRAYGKLPKEFMGITAKSESLFGVDKFGVNITSNYFESLIGFSQIPTEWQAWFYTPDYAFSEATNGEIFRDDLGIVTDFRRRLVSDFPIDVKLKKIAGHLAISCQAGQYNYSRMIKHGEIAGSTFALSEFASNILHVIFALEDRFLPYYKWRLRALKQFDKDGFYEDLTSLLSMDSTEDKADLIEKIAGKVIIKLNEKGYSTSNSDYLENHAISVQSNIKQREIRALHLMDFGG